ncbi:MAG: serine acetyltransferase [Pseudomonadota bacterium]
MSTLKYLFQDWAANNRNPKIQFFLLSFRLSQLIRRQRRFILFITSPYLVIHRIIFEWILGIELPWGTSVGPNLRIFHGHCLVVNDRSSIGANVILRHSTTIGVKEIGEFGQGKAPTIGNNVDIGANVVIIGDISIGEGCIIGAGAIVTKSIPPWSVAVGNPAKVIKSRHTNSLGG